MLIAVFTSCSQEKSVDNRPNIIYIMVDDMSYADLSSFGRTNYQTPILDAFVAEGMKFTHAYSAAAVCTPTRVGLMTGRYPARNKIGLREPLRGNTDDINMGLSPKIPTLSSMIKASGYETALFGKWHLGSVPEFFPSKHGFDYYFGSIGGHVDYIDHKDSHNRNMLYENDEPVEKAGYLTDLITDHTVDFISKKHDKPFFISLQYTSPHWPYQIPGDDPYPDSVNFRSGGSPEIFASMMKNMDDNVGRVLEAIDVAGLRESTIVIFTSDHGEMLGAHGLREKNVFYEESSHIPLLIRYPNGIAKNTKVDGYVSLVDLYATIMDYMEVGKQKSDGNSLRGLMEGTTLAARRG